MFRNASGAAAVVPVAAMAAGSSAMLGNRSHGIHVGIQTSRCMPRMTCIERMASHADHQPYLRSLRLAAMAASSFAASACCSPSVATRRFIFTSNGSPSAS